jgi:hypothetical protein
MNRATWTITLIVGIVLIVLSLPVGFVAFISIDGCCGAPSPSDPWVGALPGIGMILFGVITTAVSLMKLKELKK